MQDQEDDWFTLLDRMAAGQVVPVVGPDVLELADGTGLYESIAGTLLEGERPPSATAVDSTWPLYAAVAHLNSKAPGSVDKLRRRVARLVAERRPAELPRTLRRLVDIDAFSIFVSLTCDDWLPRALQVVDHGAYRRAFAIRSSTAESALDIPAAPPRRGVYQLLGSSENVLDFAIHDGDVLEYLYRLQSNHSRSARMLLGELRKRDLLLIGCRLPDWMGRPLLRLASGDSLSSKATQDYVCGDGLHPDLTRFLARHSPNTLMFEGDPRAFVAELATRWEAMRPSAAPAVPVRPTGPSRDGAMVFISYASEDANEARALAAQLLALGAGDVWVDKKALRAGDDWSERIGEAIDRQCRYFLPVLSLRADARSEGVFWEEWGIALRRAARIPGRFLLPTVIDEEASAHRDFRRIGREGGTGRFLERHLLHAPGGRFTTEASEDLGRLFAETPEGL
jgi:hypothetical protein